VIDPVLRALFAAAYLAELRPTVLPVSERAPLVRLDDTGRPVIVPLRRAGGDRG
jgi:hypothetical protein